MICDEQTFSEKKILVTGASGYIGKKLCKRLKELGATIYGVSTRSQEKSNGISQWFVGDLGDPEFTKLTIRNSRPEIIFHLAGFASGNRGIKAVESTFHSNLTATVNILTAATETGTERLVLAGSMEEPEPEVGYPVPVSPYAASKWASSGYARMFHKLYKTPVTISRIFMVYGPGFKNCSNLVPYVIDRLSHRKKPELTSGDRLIDWIYIDDVVEGLLLMAKAEGIEGETVDLGSGEQLSINNICKRIKTIMGSEVDIEFGALPDRPFERISIANLDMTSEFLNWKPKVGINEGLERTIRWFREHLPETTE